MTLTDRLSESGNYLKYHPNFIGTIQSFVDKFMAIPYFKEKFHSNVISIDDVKYNQHLKRIFSPWREHATINKYIYRVKNREIKKVEKNEQNDIKVEYLSKIQMGFNDGVPIFKIGKSIIAKDPNTDRYKELYDIFYRSLYEKGILKYSDSYQLASQYITKHPELREYISNRFKFVFIDEFQDNDDKQNGILEEVLDPEESIIQTFGDPNQAIFEANSKSNNISSEVRLRFDHMEISQSMRFPQKIADFIDLLKLKGQKHLTGAGNGMNLEPHIIVYNRENIVSVTSVA